MEMNTGERVGLARGHARPGQGGLARFTRDFGQTKQRLNISVNTYSEKLVLCPALRAKT